MTDPLATVFSERSGVVEAFADAEGAGSVRDLADGALALWPFHCTRLADGSRTIAVGALVRFRVEPGPNGLEAVAVETV